MLTHYLFRDLLRRRKKEKEKKKVTLIVARPAAKNNLRQKFFLHAGSVFTLCRSFEE